jgi:hypothetical protein
MALAPVVNEPMPRQPIKAKPPTNPVEKVALTKGLEAASVSGVIVQVSAEVEWMRKKGIL